MTKPDIRLVPISAEQFMAVRRKIESIAPEQPRAIVDDYTPDEVCIELIQTGAAYHDPSTRLAWRGYTADQIRAFFDASVDRGSKRWNERYREIDAAVASAWKKHTARANKFFAEPITSQSLPNTAPPRHVTFDTISAASFYGQPIPRQPWLIDGMLPAGQPSLLSGDGGLGKSYLALQLSVSVVATGMWLSRSVERGSVLYVSCEDETAEIHRRLEKISKHAGVTVNDLSGLHIAPMADRDALLASTTRAGLQMTPLFAALSERVAASRPTLVVLDSLADVYGGNEIDRAQVRWFIGQLRSLCHTTGATIVILSHPSLSGMASGSGLSGSTHWNNSVRSRLYLTRPDSGNNDERVLEVKKNNRGETGRQIELEWRNGVFVALDGGDARRFVEADIDDLFMTLLKRFTEQGRYVNASGGTTYAPSVFEKEPEAKARRIKKRQFSEAMSRLFGAGRIAVGTRKSGGHERQFIEITGDS